MAIGTTSILLRVTLAPSHCHTYQTFQNGKSQLTRQRICSYWYTSSTICSAIVYIHTYIQVQFFVRFMLWFDGALLTNYLRTCWDRVNFSNSNLPSGYLPSIIDQLFPGHTEYKYHFYRTNLTRSSWTTAAPDIPISSMIFLQSCCTVSDRRIFPVILSWKSSLSFALELQ